MEELLYLRDAYIIEHEGKFFRIGFTRWINPVEEKDCKHYQRTTIGKLLCVADKKSFLDYYKKNYSNNNSLNN